MIAAIARLFERPRPYILQIYPGNTRVIRAIGDLDDLIGEAFVAGKHNEVYFTAEVVYRRPSEVAALREFQGP